MLARRSAELSIGIAVCCLLIELAKGFAHQAVSLGVTLGIRIRPGQIEDRLLNRHEASGPERCVMPKLGAASIAAKTATWLTPPRTCFAGPPGPKQALSRPQKVSSPVQLPAWQRGMLPSGDACLHRQHYHGQEWSAPPLRECTCYCCKLPAGAM